MDSTLCEGGDYNQRGGAAPLSAEQQVNTLTIGYGVGGGFPIEFEFSVSDSPTGFVQLFVSTVHLELDQIAQDSPFEPSGPTRGNATRPVIPFAYGWTGYITLSR